MVLMSRVSSVNQIIGKRGESLAAEYLERLGMSIIARNFRCKGGEIDLIAVCGAEIHFIEVKSRSHDSRDTIEASLGASKLRAIHRASLVYLSKNMFDYDYEVIFDLVTVVEDESGEAQVEYIPSFFYPSW